MVAFNRDYAAFGPDVRPYEKADDVGMVVTEFLWWAGAPLYPIGALIKSKISSAWLGEGEPRNGDETNLDLIFKMSGYKLFEIVLRSDAGTSYGGWCYGDSLEVTNEIVAGHRVLIATDEGARIRYEFDPGVGQYLQVWTPEFARSTNAVRKSAKSLHRR
jgi:hypothetical protein